MSVPAWPMPIHHTKLVMAKPHATGTSMPQMPTPTASRYTTATAKTSSKSKLMPNQMRQPLPVGRVRTMELILSVMERKLWPGGAYCGSAATAASPKDSPDGRTASADMSLRLQLRVGIAHRRQIGRPRPRVQLGQKAVVQGQISPLFDRAAAVVQVAED